MIRGGGGLTHHPLTIVTSPKPILSFWALSFSRFSSLQSCSSVQLIGTPCTAARQASLSITNSWSLLKLMSIESLRPSNHLILCRPLLLLPSIFPSIRVFSNGSVLRIRWPKYWSFSFSTSPSNVYPRLISFRIDRLDLLAVHGTLKSLFQHYSSKASILQHSAFLMVQLSHPYMTSGKAVALTRRTFRMYFLKYILLGCLVYCLPPTLGCQVHRRSLPVPLTAASPGSRTEPGME